MKGLENSKQKEEELKMDQVLNLSKKFWKGLEAADVEAMRSVCDPDCYFVHIGGNCDLDKEMNAFAEKIFQPQKSRSTNRR